MSKLEDAICSHIDNFASTREEVVEHSVEIGRNYTVQVDSGDYYDTVYGTTYETVHHTDYHPSSIKEIIKDLKASPAEINSALFNSWLRVWPNKDYLDERKRNCINLFTGKLREYITENNGEPLASLPDSKDARAILYALRPLDCNQSSALEKIRECLSRSPLDDRVVYNLILEDSLDAVAYADFTINRDSIIKEVPSLLRRKFLEAPCTSTAYTSLVGILERKLTEKTKPFVKEVLTETARVISEAYLEAVLSKAVKAENPASYLAVFITGAIKKTNKSPPFLNLPPRIERQEVPEAYNGGLRLFCFGGMMAGACGVLAATHAQPNGFRAFATLASLYISKEICFRIANTLWAEKSVKLDESWYERNHLNHIAREKELSRYRVEICDYLRSAFKGSHPVYEKFKNTLMERSLQ